MRQKCADTRQTSHICSRRADLHKSAHSFILSTYRTHLQTTSPYLDLPYIPRLHDEAGSTSARRALVVRS